MIDINEVVNKLNEQQVIQIVSKLGCDEYQDTNNAIIFKTICHHANADDASMKLYYYKQNHLFHCYTDCGCSFNLIGLFKKHYEVLNYKYNFYNDIVIPIVNESSPFQLTTNFGNIYESDFDIYENNETKVNIKSIKKSILNVYTFYPTLEWLQNGINEESMREYNIRYSIDENKIIIPHYDIDNNLIGVRARALNDEDIEIGKYMPVKIEDKILSHPLGYNVYGLNIVKDNIKKFKMAIIGESEKSCLQYYTMFGKDKNICVATCGSSLSKYQVELLFKAGAERILIAFDKEGNTWNEQEKYFKKLQTLIQRYKNMCKIGFIWDAQNLLELKDSPFDKGKDIFLKLYKSAIWL